MADDPDYNALLAEWGTEEALQTHIEKLVAVLCPMICGRHAAVPVVELRPGCFARGLFGERSAGAEYEAAEGCRPATIGVYPRVFRRRDLLEPVLAHELIHHWEHLGADGAETLSYPDEADAKIAEKYGDKQQARWRAAHSRAFVAKSAAIANALARPLEILLFGRAA